MQRYIRLDYIIAQMVLHPLSTATHWSIADLCYLDRVDLAVSGYGSSMYFSLSLARPSHRRKSCCEVFSSVWQNLRMAFSVRPSLLICLLSTVSY